MTFALVAVAGAALVVMGAAYFIVMAAGTRLTGKQIAEDDAVRSHVDPEDRDDEFPTAADY